MKSPTINKESLPITLTKKRIESLSQTSMMRMTYKILWRRLQVDPTKLNTNNSIQNLS